MSLMTCCFYECVSVQEPSTPSEMGLKQFGSISELLNKERSTIHVEFLLVFSVTSKKSCKWIIDQLPCKGRIWIAREGVTHSGIAWFKLGAFNYLQRSKKAFFIQPSMFIFYGYDVKRPGTLRRKFNKGNWNNTGLDHMQAQMLKLCDTSHCYRWDLSGHSWKPTFTSPSRASSRSSSASPMTGLRSFWIFSRWEMCDDLFSRRRCYKIKSTAHSYFILNVMEPKALKLLA